MKTLIIDDPAVRTAVIECWSNGQEEGQINRLKDRQARDLRSSDTELFRARPSAIYDIFWSTRLRTTYTRCKMLSTDVSVGVDTLQGDPQAEAVPFDPAA